MKGTLIFNYSKKTTPTCFRSYKITKYCFSCSVADPPRRIYDTRLPIFSWTSEGFYFPAVAGFLPLAFPVLAGIKRFEIILLLYYFFDNKLRGGGAVPGVEIKGGNEGKGLANFK